MHHIHNTHGGGAVGHGHAHHHGEGVVVHHPRGRGVHKTGHGKYEPIHGSRDSIREVNRFIPPIHGGNETEHLSGHKPRRPWHEHTGGWKRT